MKLADSQYDTFEVPIHQVWVNNEFNCRTEITRQSIEELAQSIEQDGLIFPIDLRPADEVEGCPSGFLYSLVCGFRRFQSVRLLGWTSVPARVRGGLTERQAQMMNLTENLERKDLNILEEAVALEKLFPIYRTILSVSKELKKSTQWVSVRRTLLLLSPMIQKAAASGRLKERDIKVIMQHTNPDEKAKEILNAPKGQKTRHLYTRARKKSEVKAVITKLVSEGFNPHLIRLLSWCIGEVDDEVLAETLTWLRDRKGWLK